MQSPKRRGERERQSAIHGRPVRLSESLEACRQTRASLARVWAAGAADLAGWTMTTRMTNQNAAGRAKAVVARAARAAKAVTNLFIAELGVGKGSQNDSDERGVFSMVYM